MMMTWKNLQDCDIELVTDQEQDWKNRYIGLKQSDLHMGPLTSGQTDGQTVIC